MEIVQTSEINEINYVLMTVRNLTEHEDKCHVKDVKSVCNSSVFGFGSVDYWKIIVICVDIGFLNRKKQLISLTSDALEFLELNPENHYELTEKQLSFTARNVLLNGSWTKEARSLFLKFVVNYQDNTFEFDSTNTIISSKNKIVLRLAHHLGVVRYKTEFIVSVIPEYVTLVRDITRSNGKSQEELEKSLGENQALGLFAEKVIVKFEKQRLKILGLGLQADLVNQISQFDSTAGFDVESFTTDSIECDRFIEVKASRDSNLRFYWTKNEFEVAKRLGERYWIYFVGGFKEAATLADIVPIMINNPVSRLNIDSLMMASTTNVPEISVSVNKILLTAKDDLQLVSKSWDTMRAYILK